MYGNKIVIYNQLVGKRLGMSGKMLCFVDALITICWFIYAGKEEGRSFGGGAPLVGIELG